MAREIGAETTGRQKQKDGRGERHKGGNGEGTGTETNKEKEMKRQKTAEVGETDRGKRETEEPPH